MTTSKFLLALILTICITSSAGAEITKGPYLQNPREDGVVVCFETDTPDEASVYVGVDENPEIEFSGAGQPFTYEGATVYQFKIEINGCDPGTLYYYQVRTVEISSEVHTFFTIPDTLGPFRFAVLGDSRGGSVAEPNLEHEGIVAAMREWGPDLFFNTGDLVSSGANLEDWSYFFYAERELMAECPLFGAFGNHENDRENGLSGDRNWARYFSVPLTSQYPTFYSFDYLNVHFIVIDVEKWATLLLPGALQAKWLRDDLEAYRNNPKTNFVFTLFHEPPFSFEEDRAGNFASLTLIQPLLKEYGVPASFEGHDHFYARRNMSGVDHVVTGGGGAPLYDFRQFPPPTAIPGYRMHDKSNHYLRAEVTADRVSIQAVRLDGTLIEEFYYEADPPEWPDDDDSASDDDTAPNDDATPDDDAGPNDDLTDDDQAADDDDNDASPPPAADHAADDHREAACGC